MFPRRLHSFLGNTSSPLPQGQQLLDSFSSPMTEPPDFLSLPHQPSPPSLLHHQLAVTGHVGAINGSWNLFQLSIPLKAWRITCQKNQNVPVFSSR